MKLASFIVEGEAAWGVVEATGIVDGRRLFGGRFATLREALTGTEPSDLREAASRLAPSLQRNALRWLPPIPQPDKILCVGLNYRAHVEEVGRALPQEPSVFVRLAATLLADGEAIVRPRVSEQLDYEGELAVVIGRAGRHIAVDRAMDHVAGYTLFNDVSVRDWQKHSVTAGKNFDATAPCGPWIVTADDIPDPARLVLGTRLNGRTVQHAAVDTMTYTVPALIAYLSTLLTLVPGDIIATGTPAGVGSGRRPPLWMQAGDRIEVEMPGIGVLVNPVVDESPPGPAPGIT